ncbi:MAG: hypothetical protein Q9191_002053 [Dirinaria sp. TL-2023a]
MQSELIHLEAELANIELENGHSEDVEKVAFQVSLFDLKESSGTENDLQWRKSLEIREKLKEYNDALLRHASIGRLEKPSDRNTEVLREWLDRKEGGDFFLRGREAEIWDCKEDLVALSHQEGGKDCLSWWISNRLVPWYHDRWGHRSKKYRSGSGAHWNGVWQYNEETIVRLANAVSTFLSSLLPTTSILVLYFVKKPVARLAATMLFTALFSLTLVTVAKARRIDVFAATTA